MDKLIDIAQSASQKSGLDERSYGRDQIRRIRSEFKQRQIQRINARDQREAEMLIMGQSAWPTLTQKEKRLICLAARVYEKNIQSEPKGWNEYTRDQQIALMEGLFYLNKRMEQIISKMTATVTIQ